MAIPNGFTVVGEWDFTGAPADAYQRLVWQKSAYSVSSDGLFEFSYSEESSGGGRVFSVQVFDNNDENITVSA